MKFIGSILLLILGVGGFFLFTSPIYGDIQELQEQQASLDEALESARQLQTVQDELVARYNAFDQESLRRVQKVVPDSADNIRLIIEIEKLALSHDITINNVSFQVPTSDDAVEQTFVSNSSGSAQTQNQNYGTIDLHFFMEGSYQEFTEFLEALEQSLRIVDVRSLQFSSGSAAPAGARVSGTEDYQYQFTISTYWLKSR